MKTYRVYFTTTINGCIDVETTSKKKAKDLAGEEVESTLRYWDEFVGGINLSYHSESIFITDVEKKEC